MPALALYNFIPKQCPQCGKDTRINSHNNLDYKLNCSHSCDCGLHFQLVKTEDLLEAADRDGDMKRYVQ